MTNSLVLSGSLSLAATRANLLLCHLIKSIVKAFVVIFVPMTFIFMVCFCLYSVQEQAFSFKNSKKMLPGLFDVVKIVLLPHFLDQNKTSII